MPSGYFIRQAHLRTDHSAFCFNSGNCIPKISANALRASYSVLPFSASRSKKRCISSLVIPSMFLLSLLRSRPYFHRAVMIWHISLYLLTLNLVFKYPSSSLCWYIHYSVKHKKATLKTSLAALPCEDHLPGRADCPIASTPKRRRGEDIYSHPCIF